MIQFAICLCVILASFAHSLEFNETLTPDDVRTIFKMPNDSELHYEITYPRQKRHKRSTETQFHLLFDNQDITLYLNPTEGYLAGKHTRVWLAQGNKKSATGFNYYEIKNAMEHVGENFQDQANKAAIRIKRDESGNALLDGTIGDNLVIRPVPKKYLTTNSELQNSETENLSESPRPHIILKRAITPLNDNKVEFRTNFSIPRPAPARLVKKKNPILSPDLVVYPELLIFVDEILFSKLHRDISSTVNYIVTLFNGVDLRYRALFNPKVRLSIAGIVILNGFPTFMESYIKNGKAIMYPMLKDFSVYLHKLNDQIRFRKDYDIGLFVTGLDLGEIDMDGKFSSASLGMAFTAKACQAEKDRRKIRNYDEDFIKSSAIMEDNGGYNGIFAIAHELAHILGAPHDPLEDAPEECKWGSNGYIMNYFGKTSNRLLFSACSQVSIRKFLLSEWAQCLYNPPPLDQPVPIILPGTIMSMDEQCARAVRTGFCKQEMTDANICAKLKCINPNIVERIEEPCIDLFYAPAEGTTCGEKKICINGLCVSSSIETVDNLFTYTD